MAGIDNITNEILQEAEQKAASLIDEARKQAEEKLADAKKQGDEYSAKAAAKAKDDAAAYASRILSQVGMRKRQAALRAKQDIISEVIDAAYRMLASQPDSEYFSMILKLIASHVREGEGEILFSKKDLARLPEGFAGQAASLAPGGGSIVVSEETTDIDDGFILRYGGIEENCTLKALLAEKRDELSDQVALSLWQKESLK